MARVVTAAVGVITARRTMATQLIQHERIRTTLPRAKELRRVVDKLITLSKRGKPAPGCPPGGCALHSPPGSRRRVGGLCEASALPAPSPCAGDNNSRRSASAYVRTDSEVEKLFGDLAVRFDERQGGYTRVLRVGWRKGDAAPMAIIELVDRDGEARAARPAAPMRAPLPVAGDFTAAELATPLGKAASSEAAADERA